eukprot:3256445-Rhodomonas_salina.2
MSGTAIAYKLLPLAGYALAMRCPGYVLPSAGKQGGYGRCDRSAVMRLGPLVHCGNKCKQPRWRYKVD